MYPCPPTGSISHIVGRHFIRTFRSDVATWLTPAGVIVTVLAAHNPEVGVDGLDVLVAGRYKKFLRSENYPFRSLDGEMLPVPAIARRDVEYALMNARLACEAAERRNSSDTLNLSWSDEDGCDAFLEGHGQVDGGDTPHLISNYCRTHHIPITVEESERCTANLPRSYADHFIGHCLRFVRTRPIQYQLAA